MLKACWDCIASSTANRDGAQNEQESYGIRLNGANGDTQRAPPWPAPQFENEKMFILPRVLQFGDKIHVTGQMTRNRQMITLNLLTESNGSPDHQNIACQVEVRFVEDKINLQTVTDGNVEYPSMDDDPPSLLFGDSSFDFTFTLRHIQNQGIIEVDIGTSFYGKVDLKHKIEYVRFLSVYGDVEKIDKLEFEFA